MFYILIIILCITLSIILYHMITININDNIYGKGENIDMEKATELYINMVNEVPNHKKNKNKQPNRFDGIMKYMGYNGEYNIASIRDELYKKISKKDNIVLIYGNSILCMAYLYAICAIAMRKNIETILVCNYNNMDWTHIIVNPRFQIRYIEYDIMDNMNNIDIMDNMDTMDIDDNIKKIICHKSDIPNADDIIDKKNIIILD